MSHNQTMYSMLRKLPSFKYPLGKGSMNTASIKQPEGGQGDTLPTELVRDGDDEL
jgi:hypothetical protein